MTVNGRQYVGTYSADSSTYTLITPEMRQMKWVLRSDGQVEHAELEGLAGTSYLYDEHGRLSGVAVGTGADSRRTTLTYNKDGFVETVTDPLGRTVTMEYDKAGRVLQQRKSDGTSSYAYDADGNLTALTRPTGPRHRFTYTPVGLRAAYRAPRVRALRSDTLYAYDSDRYLLNVTRADSLSVRLDYDQTSRLRRLNLTDRHLAYSYDANTGRLSRIQGSDGNELNFEYDGPLLTTVKWTGEVSGSVTRTFDRHFRIASFNVNAENIIPFEYDNDGLLVRAGDLVLNRHLRTGMILSTTLGNIADTRSYDVFGDLIAYNVTNGNRDIYRVEITRDKIGRMANLVETIGGMSDNWAYGYDETGRLTEVWRSGQRVRTYGYDANGNRRSVRTVDRPILTAQYDAQDRLTHYGATKYSYTAAGELATETSGAGTRTYRYDVLGNLVSVELPSGKRIVYLIDAQNRRVGKIVDGVAVQRFLYQDGIRIIAELDGDEIGSRFVYEGGRNSPAYMIKNQITYRIVSDHIGSPRLVLDADTGAVVQRIDYDEFGNVTFDSNPGFQPFGFAGGVYDPDTGLVRFGARDYHPQLGRWTAKDPVLFGGGEANLYSYARNDPINFADPSGLDTVIIITRDLTFGTHAALWVGNSGLPILYDPAGSFDPRDADGAPLRGSGDFFEDTGADLRAYLKFQRTTGSEVEQYRFSTSPDEEASIVERVRQIGGKLGGFCAVGVSEAITGIGPFRDLDTYYFPGNLGRALRAREENVNLPILNPSMSPVIGPPVF